MSPTETTLRAVVEPLAGLVRRAGSRDEEQAARLVVDAFARVGTAARIDEVAFRDGYASLLMPLAAVGLVVGLRSAGGRRRPLGALAAAAAAAALVDDVENGRRVWRSACATPSRPGTSSPRPATGRPTARWSCSPTTTRRRPAACSTRRMQRWVARRFPGLIQRTDTSIPLWWTAAAGPALAALVRRRARRCSPAPARCSRR